MISKVMPPSRPDFTGISNWVVYEIIMKFIKKNGQIKQMPLFKGLRDFTGPEVLVVIGRWIQSGPHSSQLVHGG